MHELAVTRSILEIALRYAEEDNASKIVSIGVTVGELRNVVEEWMQRYFDYLSRDTIAAQARLRVSESPIVFECSCGERFVVSRKDLPQPLSPCCGQQDVVLVSGNEFYVNDIEVL
jgi:hydrogenase nickel incorporation protein HypA/HybF